MNATDIIFSALLGIVAFAGGWFLRTFFCRNGNDLHDNGGTTQQVRDELDAVEAGQREAQDAVRAITEGLDVSQGAVSDIAETGRQLTESINNAQRAGDEGRQLIDDSGQRIAECENIIREVREGAHKD